MTRKELHPFGEERPDTVAQALRDKKLANLCAEVMERMTGEPCYVLPRGENRVSCWFLMRAVGERWVRA